MTDRSSIGRNNKSRSKGYERDAACILGTERYPADTGGLADLKTVAGFVCQVKSGQRLVGATIFEGLDAARAVAGLGEIGAAVCYHRGAHRLRKVIVFDLHEFADFHGLGVKEETDA